MTEAVGLGASGPRGLSAALRGYLTDLARELRLSLLSHRWLIGLVCAYWLAGIVVAYYANMPTGATIETYLPIYMEMMPGMLLTLVIGRCLVIMLIERPARPLTQIIAELRGSMFIPRGHSPSVDSHPITSSVPLSGSISYIVTLLWPRLVLYRKRPLGWIRISAVVLLPANPLGSVEFVCTQMKAPRFGS